MNYKTLEMEAVIVDQARAKYYFETVYKLMTKNLKGLCAIQTREPEDISSNIMLVNEGIEHYIIKLLNYNLTFDENINALANKKYSKSRIRRTLLSMFLKIPNIIEENIPLRILGFSKLGEQYLNKLNNIIVNIKQVNSYYIEQEIKLAKLYSLITNSDITITEYMFPRKEK